MRLSEMTDEQLIRQVEDDALAREIFNRLVLSKLRVSDEVQALEHQRDKAQDDYEKAMHRASFFEHRCERILSMVQDDDDIYGIGSMCSMWTGRDMASDIAARLQQDEASS